MKGISTLPAGAEIRNIPVVFDPHVTDPAETFGFWPLHRIAVGHSWFQLEAEEQAAVLLHEVHHCKALHREVRVLLSPWRNTAFAQRIARRQEMAADAFAARCGYAGPLITFLSKHQYHSAPLHPSPMERVDALMKGART